MRRRTLLQAGASAAALGLTAWASPARTTAGAAGPTGHRQAGGEAVIDESFDGDGIPQGWTPYDGSWTVENGTLVGVGDSHGNPPARIVFGPHLRDYQLDVTLRITKADDGTRWVGVGLDMPTNGSAPWSQATMRADTREPTEGNAGGLEFSWRTFNNTWDVTNHTVADSYVGVGATAKLSFTVHGPDATMTITAPNDTVTTFSTKKLDRSSDGRLALIVDGATVTFDQVKVTQLQPEPILSAVKAGGAAMILAGEGNSSVAPTGTLAAFRSALMVRRQVPETVLMGTAATIRLSSDGVPVVRHDESLAATTNGSGTIADTTADDLATLDAGSWFSPDYAHAPKGHPQPILTLARYLADYASTGNASLLRLPGQAWASHQDKLGDLLAAPLDLGATLVESDNTDVLKTLAADANHQGRTIQLVLADTDPNTDILTQATGLKKTINVVAVDISADNLSARNTVIRQLEKASISTIVSGADQPDQWKAATATGAKAVITTKPDRMAGWQQGTQEDPSSAPAPMIAGHRGNPGLIGDGELLPENSLASHEAGWRSGASYVEDDINLSYDQHYVVMHDGTVNRTTCGTGEIKSMNWSQINKLEVGAKTAPEFDGLPVPQLSDVLNLMKRSAATDSGPRKLLLEFKDDWGPEHAPAAIKELEKYFDKDQLKDRVLLQGFSTTTMSNLADAALDMERGLLVNDVTSATLSDAGRTQVNWLNPSSAALHHSDYPKNVHEAGLKTAVWTTESTESDTPENWRRAMDSGVDMIITNRPDYLEGWLAGRPTT